MNFISHIGFDAFKMCAPHKKREYNSNYDLITHKKNPINTFLWPKKKTEKQNAK